MKKLYITLAFIISFTVLNFAPASAHESYDGTQSVDSNVIEESLKEKGLDQAPGVVEVPKSEMLGEKPYSGFKDENGNPISDEEYARIREEKTGPQWKNIGLLLAGVIVIGGGIAAAIIVTNKKKN